MDELSAETLDRFRNYLRMLAGVEISPQIRQRVAPSDIVQETLIEAYDKRSQFRGQTDGELAQWLRTMLLRNVFDAHRMARRQRRDVAREQNLGTLLHDSTTKLAESLAANQTSPSGCVSKMEQVIQLADALAELPKDQQQAIVLHHLQGMSLAETAPILDRSQSAVASLIFRGLKRLRSILAETEA